MNENVNLSKILRDCLKGTKLYSPVFGDVELDNIDIHSDHPIRVLCKYGDESFSKEGRLFFNYDGECMLFPSKDQRDWSKFKPKKPKFDPATLKPFDKVLVKDRELECWRCGIFSYIYKACLPFEYLCIGSCHAFCIPYNEDTEHLVGTSEEAPEFYRYWED